MANTTLTIIRAGQFVLVKPPVNELMGAFVSTVHVAVDDARYGVKIVQQPYPLAWPHELHGEPVTETYVIVHFPELGFS